MKLGVFAVLTVLSSPGYALVSMGCGQPINFQHEFYVEVREQATDGSSSIELRRYNKISRNPLKVATGKTDNNEAVLQIIEDNGTEGQTIFQFSNLESCTDDIEEKPSVLTVIKVEKDQSKHLLRRLACNCQTR